MVVSFIPQERIADLSWPNCAKIWQKILRIYVLFRKSSAGFNLTNLFVGSEGSLGFITKATLKIYGIPEMMLSAVCAFTTIKAAVDTCVQILQSNIPIARIGST